MATANANLDCCSPPVEDDHFFTFNYMEKCHEMKNVDAFGKRGTVERRLVDGVDEPKACRTPLLLQETL